MQLGVQLITNATQLSATRGSSRIGPRLHCSLSQTFPQSSLPSSRLCRCISLYFYLVATLHFLVVFHVLPLTGRVRYNQQRLLHPCLQIPRFKAQWWLVLLLPSPPFSGCCCQLPATPPEVQSVALKIKARHFTVMERWRTRDQFKRVVLHYIKYSN